LSHNSRRFAYNASRLRYYVYVIELDAAVKKSRKFLERNAGMLPFGQCYYVGQSVHDPDCRYRQHKECWGDEISFACICHRRKGRFTKRLSNYFARKHGRFLARKLFEHLNPLPTRADAERAEERLARELQADGHGVWWG
jgi:hypothetical protein